MPLTLVHSLPGREKLDHLISEIVALEAAQKPWTIVTSSGSAVAFLKRVLLKCLPALAGQHILTTNEFLEKQLRRSHLRFHKADNIAVMGNFYARARQRKLPEAQAWSWSAQAANISRLLKTRGILPQNLNELQELLPLPFDAKAWLTETHEDLISKHEFDTGDLWFETLKRLSNKDFQNSITDEALFFFGLYPLHAGHRELLGGLRLASPHRQITIYYDEDFSRADGKLSRAYEDLGILCDEAVAIATETNLKTEIVTTFSPAHEEQLACDWIKKLNQQGAPAHDLAICANPRTLSRIAALLSSHGHAISTRYPRKISEVFPDITTRARQALQDLNKDFSKTYSESKLEPSAGGFPFWRDAKIAQAELCKTAATISFWQKILPESFGKLSEPEITVFFERLAHTLILPEADSGAHIVLCDWRKAWTYADRNVLGLGAFFENFAPSPAAPTVEHHLLDELLETRIENTEIGRESVRQLAGLASSAKISRPQNDSDGRPTSPLPILKDWPETAEPYLLPAEAVRISAPQIDFTPANSKNISVSAIQAYQDCPYRYYIEHVLNLNGPRWHDADGYRDDKGTFLHAVLSDWIGSEPKLYAQSLNDDEIQKTVIHNLDLALERQKSALTGDPEVSPQLSDAFLERTKTACLGLLAAESKLVKNGGKKTNPVFFERRLNSDIEIALPDHSRKISFNGRIDRVDQDPDTGEITIIDYKTGSAKNLGDITNGVDLQLPLYAAALATELRCEIAGFHFYDLKKGEFLGVIRSEGADAAFYSSRQGKRRLSDDDFEKIMTAALNQAHRARDGIAAQQFDPNPRDASECQNCRAKSLCPSPRESDENEFTNN